MIREFALLSAVSLALNLLPTSKISLAGLSAMKQEYTEAGDNDAMAQRVKEEFLHAWTAYKKFAWGHDELRPVSKSYRDWYARPLYITAVEALDTMLIMGLDKEADETREFIAQNLHFDHDMMVQVFEVNIRVLGGLLSAYQLSGDERLLMLAQDLGKRLLPAFASKTGMPFTHVNLRTGRVEGEKSNPAEIGSFILEFGTLSALTNNPSYFDTAKKALVRLYKSRADTDLVGSSVDVQTGKWLDETSHIGGGIDSYYEYLFKCALLFDDQDCRKMWETSKDALHYYLEHSTQNGLWYSRANMQTGEVVARRFAALDSFFAGVLALDGDIERAKKLQATYYRLWKLNGAMPETFHYDENRLIWGVYQLRPEAMESAFYLFRLTGEQEYVEMAKRFFWDLKRYCWVENGFSGLANIETGRRDDRMESFFLAETLKYLYLLFAPAKILDLDDVVFTTEAHLIRRSPLMPKRESQTEL